MWTSARSASSSSWWAARHIYISIYLHITYYLFIYISTYPGGRGGVLAPAGDPARVRALLPHLHPVPVQGGGLPVGLQPEHPPHPRPGGTNIKFYQYIIKIFSANK